jgi:tape measure domain-containing protein
MASSFSVSTIFGAKDRMSPAFDKMGNKARGFGNILKGILGARVIEQGFRTLVNQAKSFVSEAQKIEDATASFTPLMGGVEKATELVNRLNKEAATTPFQFEGISGVAKQLLPVMNQNIEKTADTFRMLGDTAGGNIQKLESITRGYTKALLKGKPDMEALNMISEAGVPIFSEMSKSMGITQAQLFELSKQGKLTNDDLTKAFQRMTSEGGIFFNGMQIASETLTGKLSTLSDNVALTKASIGSALLPIIKPAVDGFITLAQKARAWAEANKEIISTKIQEFIAKVKSVIERVTPGFKKIWESIKGLIGTVRELVGLFFKGLIPGGKKAGNIFDTFSNIISFVIKAASTLLGILKPLMPLIKIIGAAILAVVIAMKAWATIQAIMNFLMTANPIGLIIAAIGVLIGIIVLVVQHWEKVKAAFISVWEKIKTGVSNIWENVKSFFGKIRDFIVGVWDGIKSIATGLWDGFINGINSLWEGVKSVFGKIKDFIKNTWDKIKGPFEKIGNFFKKIFDRKKTLTELTQEAIEEAQASVGIEAPNQREAEARSQIQFQGQINIAGAPDGSTASGTTTGAPPIRMQMMGAN